MSLQTVVRSYQAQVDDIKASERTIVSRIGGKSIDRHRSIIDPAGIDLTSYAKNPIVLFEHGRDPARGFSPVGKNLWIKCDGDRLIAKTKFRSDPYSDELFRAYEESWLSGWSINVLAHEASPPTREEIRTMPELEHGCEVIFRRTELAEYSCVAIPSHRDALTILVSRGIWVPDDVKAEIDSQPSTRTTANVPIDLAGAEPRTTTDSCGGLAGGGAAVKPNVKGGKDSEDEDDDDEQEPDGHDEDGKPKFKRKPKGKDKGNDKANDEPAPDSVQKGGVSAPSPVMKSAPESAPAPVIAPRTAPYIDTDGGEWMVREPDGRVVARYRDAATAEECLRGMSAPNSYERLLLRMITEHRSHVDKAADDLIARIELDLFGKC